MPFWQEIEFWAFYVLIKVLRKSLFEVLPMNLPPHRPLTPRQQWKNAEKTIIFDETLNSGDFLYLYKF